MRKCIFVVAWILFFAVSVLVASAQPQLDSRDPGLVQGFVKSAQLDKTQGGLPGWQMVGQVGGPTEDVAVQGDYAYVAVGLRLVVLDVSQPIKPTRAGSTTPFLQFVEGVAVSGTLAYVADGAAGLHIVDVSDPNGPAEIGAYNTPGYAQGVAVAGQYAYVADGHYGLRIVDVSDPARPVEVGYAYSLNYAFDLAVEGQYVYLAAAGAGLLVVEVSDPAHPVELATCETPGYAYGVDVADGVAYVADGWEDLHLVDVSDPAHPVEVSARSTPGWTFGVAVSGTTAYVADAFGGLRVLDVSDPAHPVEFGGYEVTGGHAGRVAVAGDTVYVADRNWGLRVIDVSNPGAPEQIGFYGPLGHATAVAVSENHACIAAGTYGLRVADVSDPAHAVEVGAYDTHNNAVGVAVGGGYAYVVVMGAGGSAGLHVVDVSDPAQPTGVGFCPSVGMPRDIVAVGDIAYVADEWGLELIDVSSPYTPTVAGYINLQGEEWAATTGVEVSGTLAYVAGDGGLYIIDVSNPVSPSLVSNLFISEGYYDVDVAGTRAYLTGGGNCLRVADVSDPLDPTPLGVYCGASIPERVTMVSSTAYVAYGHTGLVGIDTTDPLSLTAAFAYDTAGYALASLVVGDYAYVADGPGGLLILEPGGGQSAASGPMWNVPTSAAAPRFPIPQHSERISLLQRGRDSVGGQGQPAPGHPLSTLSSPDLRRIATTCVVTSTADSGPGTLRACMEGAVSGDTITFDPVVFPPSSPATVTLQTGLPLLWQGNVTIDASDAGVVLDGSIIQGTTILSISSHGNAVRGLQILNAPWAGIHLCCGAQHNVVGGNRTRGSGPAGEGNVISGNGVVGVSVCDSGTMYNVIIGNLIGTDASGTLALGNDFDGVDIYHGASFNTIGSLVPGEGNVVSGNRNAGVVCSTDGTMGNAIIGNFIGTDITGGADLGNGWSGVIVEMGAFNNRIEGNLVSGNDWGGIGIGDGDWGASYNIVVGNRVGTDASGTRALANDGWGGVGVSESFNCIGGTSPGDANLISGNRHGVVLEGNHNLVLGNLIGTDLSGTQAISNTREVFIHGADRSFVGGATDAERNLISGNGSVGLSMEGVEHIFVVGNYIGTDIGGTRALGNRWGGIDIGGAKYSVIQGNLIAGNQGAGVVIGEGSDFSHLRANRIGVTAEGSPLPNGSDGASISAASNIIGGPYAEDGNIIAFNSNVGVQVWTYPGNTIRRNSIYGNSGPGIFLADGGNNMLAAPIITDVLTYSVLGTACPGCIVELFSDEEDEGRVYEGCATADGSGNWAWSGALSGPYVAATATDETGNTSAFSAPQMALRHRIFLPLMLRDKN